MKETNYWNPFERYADDIVIHCVSRKQSEDLLKRLRNRMIEYGLELHPEKTKVVYCRNYFRKEEYEQNSFVFLGYSFQPRTIRDMYGKKKCFAIFSAAISRSAKKGIRAKLKEVLQVKRNVATLEWFKYN